MRVVPSKAEKIEVVLRDVLSKHIMMKALMKVDYFRRTLRLGRINLILSAQDNVILYMKTTYRTFFRGNLEWASLLPNINYR